MPAVGEVQVAVQAVDVRRGSALIRVPLAASWRPFRRRGSRGRRLDDCAKSDGDDSPLDLP